MTSRRIEVLDADITTLALERIVFCLRGQAALSAFEGALATARAHRTFG